MADNMGVNPYVPEIRDPQTLARELVYEYITGTAFDVLHSHPTFALDEVFVVWYSKSLGNWKAVISTSLPDGFYYEVTHNGAKKETYLDVYHKIDHQRFPLAPDNASASSIQPYK